MSQIKKYWGIRSKEGTRLEFFPIAEVNDETGEVEMRWIKMRFKDEQGKEVEMTFNYLDIYMFIYFTANEELRQQLAQRQERQANYIPYDITVSLTPEEKTAGVVKRRVELPVDELTMAIARNEAYKLMLRSKTRDPRNFVYKNKK